MDVGLRAFAPKTNGAPAGAIDYFFGFDTACLGRLFFRLSSPLSPRAGISLVDPT
jgi:hypothetical protein